MPAITTSGDTNTGIWFPAADTIAFTEGGVESMRITSAGSVGIGNTTPARLLTVAGTTGDASGILRLQSTNINVADGLIGGIEYFNTDTSNDGPQVAASIGAYTTSALGSGGYLAFATATGATGVEGAPPIERMRIESSGNVIVTSVGGLGYGTGSGGTVTQATSRTTGVTLNKTNGAITLVSAAGLATFQSFTVTNSTVAATDVVHVTQKSGTDLYQIFVTATAAGSFRITFATTGGITVEQPVFNFAVIKAVTA